MARPRSQLIRNEKLYGGERCKIWRLVTPASDSLPEVATAEVSTLRSTLFEVGAVVNTRSRRIWFHFSSTWPGRSLLIHICEMVATFATSLQLTKSAGVPP
jgi:hypothetical protein